MAVLICIGTGVGGLGAGIGLGVEGLGAGIGLGVEGLGAGIGTSCYLCKRGRHGSWCWCDKGAEGMGEVVICAKEEGMGVGVGVTMAQKAWEGLQRWQYHGMEAAEESVTALMMSPVTMPPPMLPQVQKINLDVNLQYSYSCSGR